VDKDGPTPGYASHLGPCWLWTGRLDPKGYGRIDITVGRYDRPQLAHRIGYELQVGPIAIGLELDHLCRNPPCVRGSRLEPVTHRVNVLRGNASSAMYARRTHCNQGHPFQEDNLVHRKNGIRDCLTCARNRMRQKRERGWQPWECRR